MPENSEQAEIIRKKYKYRQLILSGKLILPHDEATRLLGPDCAYHLYSLPESKKSGKKKQTHRKRKTP